MGGENQYSLQGGIMNALRAGTARLDITPQLGHNLAGWIDVRPATRQVTPILLRALALGTNQVQVLIFTCDLVGIGSDLLQRIEEEIREKLGIPRSHVFVLPSHNHYGPSVYGSYAGDTELTAQEAEYTRDLIEKFALAAQSALENLQPVKLGVGYGEEKNFSQNSRFWRKDGTINWVGDRPTHFDHESGPVDPQVGVLHIVDENDHPLATLFNYACHANTAEPDGFSAISWDWPGYTAQEVERVLGGEGMFLPGAAGNIHPIREGIAEQMGKALAGAVISANSELKTIESHPLEIYEREMILPARDFSNFDPHQIELICSQLWDSETQHKVQEIFMHILNNLQGKKLPDHVRRMRVVTLGYLALVFIPGEPFTEFGLQVKAQSPFPHTFVVESLGESLGYIPTRVAYQEGGYQPGVGTRLAPGGGEQIRDEALALLKGAK
jgi:neutral ceramidase